MKKARICPIKNWHNSPKAPVYMSVKLASARHVADIIGKEAEFISNISGYENVREFINYLNSLSKRSHARCGWDIECHIPWHFTKKQRKECVSRFMRAIERKFDLYGIANVHNIDKNTNCYFRLFVSDRHIENGRLAKKKSKPLQISAFSFADRKNVVELIGTALLAVDMEIDELQNATGSMLAGLEDLLDNVDNDHDGNRCGYG